MTLTKNLTKLSQQKTLNSLGRTVLGAWQRTALMGQWTAPMGQRTAPMGRAAALMGWQMAWGRQMDKYTMTDGSDTDPTQIRHKITEGGGF